MAGAQRFDTDRPAEQHVVLGMALRLLSAVSIALMFAGVKWVAQRGVHVVETMFYRQIGTALCAFAWAAFGRHGISQLRTRRLRAHVTRMSLSLVGMALNFLAMILLPLAEATAIGFSVPIFATVLAATVLGEKTGAWRWSAVVIGFIGVLIVLQPGSAHIPMTGGLVAVAAALTTACATVVIRKLGATEAAATTVFWFAASSLVPLAFALPFFAGAHEARVWLVLAGLSIAGGVAQLALTGALRLAPVALVMPMDYSSLIWATLLGLTIFQQLPSHYTWAGAPVIILSGLVIVWREQRLRKGGTAAQAVPD
jgi:drug/metabolite transporter (DMT)-like permease